MGCPRSSAARPTVDSFRPFPSPPSRFDVGTDIVMASVAEIKALMDAQRSDSVASVKEEFASMRAELAKELRAELRDFVQQDIAKNTRRVRCETQDVENLRRHGRGRRFPRGGIFVYRREARHLPRCSCRPVWGSPSSCRQRPAAHQFRIRRAPRSPSSSRTPLRSGCPTLVGRGARQVAGASPPGLDDHPPPFTTTSLCSSTTPSRAASVPRICEASTSRSLRAPGRLDGHKRT